MPSSYIILYPYFSTVDAQMDQSSSFLDDFSSWCTETLPNTTPVTILHYFNMPEDDPFNNLASQFHDLLFSNVSAIQSNGIFLDPSLPITVPHS